MNAEAVPWQCRIDTRMATKHNKSGVRPVKSTGNTSARKGFLDAWLQTERPEPRLPDLLVLTEKDGARKRVKQAIEDAVTDHIVGLEIIERIGGFKKAAAVIRNKLPTSKKIRSGDIGEVIATEYVSQQTGFVIPVKRLRRKDDRDTAMRGDDVIGFRSEKSRHRLLKVESKSRAALAASVVKSAHQALMKHSGRPNPSSLAFISTLLRELGDDAVAKVFEELQTTDIPDDAVEHLIFTLSGNDPVNALKGYSTRPKPDMRRHSVGVVIQDHQSFIQNIFKAIDARHG